MMRTSTRIYIRISENSYLTVIGTDGNYRVGIENGLEEDLSFYSVVEELKNIIV